MDNNATPSVPTRARTSSSRYPFHGRANTSPTNIAATRHSFQSESNIGHQFDSSPPITRRNGTSETVELRPIAEIPQRPNWRAGTEPGLDPLKENGGRSYIPTQNTPCQIKVVDFSKTHIEHHDLDNDSLPAFLEKDRDFHSPCRWINVNKLSWESVAFHSVSTFHFSTIEWY